MSITLLFEKQTLADDWMSFTVINWMLQNLNWMHINEIENKITDVLRCNDVYSEFVYYFVKLLVIHTKLSELKRNWLL